LQWSKVSKPLHETFDDFKKEANGVQVMIEADFKVR
jgi:hypothetical protein